MINYRPVSLISNLAKVLEKVIKKRITDFTTKYNILSEMQFGFQEGRSTQDAIAYVTQKIYQNLDNSEPTICIFVDLEKAFDTVSHSRLLNKLEHLGFRGNAIKLMESYLSNREQYVQIEESLSQQRIVEYGVPQGTVLGPILFNLYINDLLTLPCKGTILSFADDTIIMHSAVTWTQLKQIVEEEFKTIKNWFDVNLLTINCSKTRYLPFTSYQSNLPKFGPLQIHTEKNKKLEIEEAEYVKYLGILIDKHLRWDLQVNNTIKKLRILLPKFKYLRQFLNLPQMYVLYYALIQSQLTYGIIGWGGVNNNYLKNLEILQKWFLKIIFQRNIAYSTNILYEESKIFDIRQLYCQSILLFQFKHKNELKYKVHNYETRYKNTISEKKRVKKTIGERTYAYLAPRIFDLLPSEIKNTHTLRKYKIKIKIWLRETPRMFIHQMIDSKNTYHV